MLATTIVINKNRAKMLVGGCHDFSTLLLLLLLLYNDIINATRHCTSIISTTYYYIVFCITVSSYQYRSCIMYSIQYVSGGYRLYICYLLHIMRRFVFYALRHFIIVLLQYLASIIVCFSCFFFFFLKSSVVITDNRLPINTGKQPQATRCLYICRLY